MKATIHQAISAVPLIAALQQGDNDRLRSLLEDGCPPETPDEAHRPALLIAARLGRMEAARMLLMAGASANACSTSWETPILAAAAAGHEEMFTLLLEAGADISCHTKAQTTLLHAAANGGSSAILTRALELLPEKINARQRNGETPLIISLQRNNTEAVRQLLEAGANPCLRDSKRRELTEIARSAAARALIAEALKGIYAELPRKLAYHEAVQASGGEAPRPLRAEERLSLEYAVYQESEEKVRLALEDGDSPNSTCDYDDWTVLHEAASRGNTPIVRILLEAGADVNAEAAETYCMTPLHAAAFNGNAETVRLLVEAGAPLNAELYYYHSRHLGDDGTETPLELAISRGHLHAARALMQAGSNLQRVNSEGVTPLLRALLNHQTNIALEIAALAPESLDAAGTDGVSPLISCVRYRETEGLQQLLALGANPDAVSAEGNTALHESIGRGYEQGIDLLLSGGAAIDIANARGETPLHLAAMRGDVETARALLMLGADPQARTAAGKTPLQLAERPAVRELLG